MAIDLVVTNFDDVARMSDEEVFEHMRLICWVSRKRLVPAKIRSDAFYTSRGENNVSVHLLWDEKEVFRFGFIPAPSFARI